MVKSRKTFWTKRNIEKTLIVVFSLVVVLAMIATLLFVYVPNKNSLGALASVCMDVMSILLIFILIMSIIFNQMKMMRSTKFFLLLLLGTMWALIMDFLNWALDGSLEYGSWGYAFTLLSLCSGAILAALLICYLTIYMDEAYNLKAPIKTARVLVILNSVAFVATIVLGSTNLAFGYSDGHYETGVMYDLVGIVPILTVFYMTIFSIAHIKDIGLHDVISIVGFILFMITGAVVESAYVIGTTYVSVAIADIFLFVMIQNNFIKEARENVEKWRRISNLDDMTGFYNRHAYEEDLLQLAKGEIKDNLVYVSLDVNGLKVINDTLGHSAGDELIVGACDCIRTCLAPFGRLYRTGGDEFAAIIYADKRELDDIEKNIAKICSNWHGSHDTSLAISYGYVTMAEADNMSLHQMAVLADKRMYESKTRYYQKKGIDRRGQRDAHVALCALYSKILKVNITEDTYQIVNMNVSEMTKDKGFEDSFSKWCYKLGHLEIVHPDYLQEFTEKTDIAYLSEHFKKTSDPVRLMYLRKYGEKYKKTILEIIPANDYSDSIQNLFLYVKNVDDM